MDEKITQYLKSLDGITCTEWTRLCYILSAYFKREKGKFESQIKLSLTDEITTRLLSE